MNCAHVPGRAAQYLHQLERLYGHGHRLPSAIAAKRVHSQRKGVALCGDAGFMMISQGIETALRLKTPIAALI